MTTGLMVYLWSNQFTTSDTALDAFRIPVAPPRPYWPLLCRPYKNCCFEANVGLSHCRYADRAGSLNDIETSMYCTSNAASG